MSKIMSPLILLLVCFIIFKAELEIIPKSLIKTKKSLFKKPTFEDFVNNTLFPKKWKPIYAKIKDYPFMAKLYIDFNDGQVQCGGTLINPSWVLTAAHCIDRGESHSCKTKISKITVCMGVSYLPTINACTNNRLVQSITKPLRRVDMAMLFLKEPFTITRTIQPLAIQEYDISKISIDCKIMGWGWLQPGIASPHLLHTNVKRVDECNEGLICVMADEHAPCKGDSGGPLICDKILIGIASVGENADCDAKSGLTAYVPVWQHQDFIKKTIKDSACHLSAHVHVILLCLAMVVGVIRL